MGGGVERAIMCIIQLVPYALVALLPLYGASGSKGKGQLTDVCLSLCKISRLSMKNSRTKSLGLHHHLTVYRAVEVSQETSLVICIGMVGLALH